MTRFVNPERVLRRGNAGLAHLAVLLLVAIMSVLALPRAALADQPGAHTVPVAVLGFDSDDAEDQADALSGALRSRIRAAQGWSLIDTTQSLGMMTAAFKCPSRPPPECQQKIAEQIKAERYIFGFVTKGPTAGQVTAEVHLYQKGKPDTVLKETYADNLKDSNDDTLRKIAARVVERLGGTAVGVIIVRSPDQTGEIVVDGEKHVPLDKGTARIELAAGGHSVEVAPAKGPSSKRNVIVTAGRETVVEFTSSTGAEAPPPSKSHTRKIVGGATMGVGAVLGTIAVIQLVRYLDLQSQGEDRKNEIRLAKDDPNREKPCREYDQRCTKLDKDSNLAGVLAWSLGGAGAVALGVGAYLFFTDSGSSEKSAAPKTRLVPSVGAGSGSLTVVGSF
jgi:hypothetical protein